MVTNVEVTRRRPKRDRMFIFQVTDDELAKIHNLAEREMLSASSWARRMLLGGRMSDPV
jgi:hypothetical protein